MTPQDIASRITQVNERIERAAIAAGRHPEDIQLIAVSKTKPTELIAQAIAAGLTIFGENYIQEARDKFNALAAQPIHWHFIGHLQSNKAKYAVRLFDLIHSVDSIKLATEIDRQAAKIDKIQPILIQVNISREATKSGLTADETIERIQQISALTHVRVRGLMTMPPFFDDPDRARPYFARLHELRDAIAAAGIPNVEMRELSMGMTGDFEAAIAEGATLVRIGTAIFGSRA
jgi:pyridoxal phosphate enzyme (YggS family)